MIKYRICLVEDCDRTNYRRGYCSLHYQRFMKYGDPMFTKLHHYAGTPEYQVWAMMIQRCHNPRFKKYEYWGGRGIKVCKSWRESYLNFLKDMGHRPAPKLSLDRIDNNGNYEPGNVRWATYKEQMANTRRSAPLNR